MISTDDLEEFAPTVWTVVFIPKEVEDWFDHLSPKWARHVMAFGYIVQANAWIVVDPVQKHHRIFYVPDETFMGWLEMLRLQPIRAVRIRQQAGSTYNARLGNWCTQTIARLTGVRSSALRPVALYRDLLKAGAYPVFEESNVDQDQSPQNRGRSSDQETSRAG